ncbi:MAG: Do family serine endopeptidase [Pseudomonadales bacterium]|nr:Do family serine endopeptidase [Pseudomonadales bacterium]
MPTRRIFLYGTLFLIFALVMQQASAQGLPEFTGLVETNAPAIVNVSTVRRANPEDNEDRQNIEEILRYFYGDSLPAPLGNRNRERASVGSGFLISPDGFIITNHHVIDQADEVKVTLNDQREFIAKIVGSDKRSDLAVLKIEAQNLPSVRLGRSHNLKVGEWVLAIGSPFGLSYSVAAGIVSYIGRSLPSEDAGNYVSYIQTDVAINPGHSGGPLFNLAGEVIGINSQIFTNSGGSIGLSFAIPVDVAINVVGQIRAHGEVSRGWMGVQIGDVTQTLAEAFHLDRPHGALIDDVQKGSPADIAGFKTGDIVVGFNDEQIRNSGDLPYHVGLATPGSRATVDIIRDGRNQALRMTVGKLEDTERARVSLLQSARDPLGLDVSDVDREILKSLDIVGGVVVAKVRGKVASDAGLRKGDILISLNGEQIESVSDFQKIVGSLPSGRALPLLVARNGRQSFFTIRIAERLPE